MLSLSSSASLKITYWLKRAVSIICLCIAANTSAVTQQSFTLPLTFEHESNPRFTVSDEQSINRVSLVPSYSLNINQGTEKWLVKAGIHLEQSSDKNISEDRNDPSLELGWEHSYETGQFEVTTLLNNQSTRVTEFTDSGQISEDNTRKTQTILINWLNNLNDRASLTFNGDATNVSFDGLNTTGLINYSNESVNVSFNYTLMEQLESFVQLSLSRYKPEDTNSFNSETKGINLGLSWNVNEKLNIAASAGTNETKSESSAQSINNNWQAMLNVDYATLKTNSRLSISRNLSPSSTGSINETNQIAVGWTYNLSERDNFALDANWRQNLTLNRTETISLLANYTRQISLSWDFSLSAAHRNRNDSLTSVSSNSMMASIRYNLLDF